MRMMLEKAHETGTDVVIGKIDEGKQKEFRTLAKEYGLKYHVAHKYKEGRKVVGVDFMFLDSDMNKLAAVADRLGLKLQDFNLSLFKVTEMRESIKRKLDQYEKEQRAGGASRSRNEAREDNAENPEHDAPEEGRVTIHHQVSDMSTDDIVGLMRDIRANKKEAYTPENWRAYLEMQSMIYNYSEKNKEIIMKAGGTLAMSKSNWLAVGRRITDDARGIKIWKPDGRDDDGKPKFEQVDIYDIMDTQGLDIEMGVHFHRTDEDTLYDVAEYSKSHGCKVEEREGLDVDAYFDAQTETIYLKTGLTASEQILALEREQSISRMYQPEESFPPIPLKKRFTADTNAYIACTKLGVDCSSIKFEYLQELVEKDPGHIDMLQKFAFRNFDQHLNDLIEKATAHRSMSDNFVR